MSTRVIVDSNIVIDLLNGIAEAKTELLYHADRAISAVTWMELMTAFHAQRESGVMASEDYDTSVIFLNVFPVIDIDKAVMGKAAELRGHSLVERSKKKLALPDAIIKASSEVTGRTLITRNTKDFSNDDPLVRVPYIAKVSHRSPAITPNIFTAKADLIVVISDVAEPPTFSR